MADFSLANQFSSLQLSSLQACLLPLIGLTSVLWPEDCSAQVRYSADSSYYPYTIARAQDRQWIRSLPMEQRPDRPLHFYGNFVRRTYSVQRPTYSAPVAPLQTAPVRVIPVQVVPTVEPQFAP